MESSGLPWHCRQLHFGGSTSMLDSASADASAVLARSVIINQSLICPTFFLATMQNACHSFIDGEQKTVTTPRI
jgi:hypothetical protein